MHHYFEMGEQTFVQLQGSDRVKLLNNLCTQELRTLSSGRGTEAFLTDVKGRVLSHVLVVVKERLIELVTLAGQADRIMQHLDRYTIREDIVAKDLSMESSWLAFASASIAVNALAIDPSAIPLEPYSHREIITDFNDSPQLKVQLFRWPYVGSEGIVVCAGRADLPILKKHIESNGIRCAHPNDFDAMRIGNAWPLFGIDFDDKNLPQEIGRDTQAISFTKGCYLGQETVARLDALGQVQKKLVRLRIDSTEKPTPGVKLTGNDIDVGWITSSSMNDGYSLAFGFVKRAFMSPRTKLRIGESEATVL